MKKKIFYIIRYSVLQESNAWKLSRENDFENYKRRLFSEERMLVKEQLFSSLTLPSLNGFERADEEYDREIIILISKQLPDQNRNFLNNLESDRELTILEIDAKESMFAVLSEYITESVTKSSEDLVYATVRIDDDDLLAPFYERRLINYLNTVNLDYLISFPDGLEVLVNTIDQSSPEIVTSKKSRYPKLALGLAHIGFFNCASKKIESQKCHIYQTGKHTTVDERFRMIYDMTPNAYTRTSYDESDTQGKGFAKRTQSSDPVSEDVMLQYFPPIEKLIRPAK